MWENTRGLRSYAENLPGFVWYGRAVALVAVALASDCAIDPTVRCGDLVCPRDFVCADRDGIDECISPSQIAACTGLSDGDLCSFPGVSLGTCEGGVCVGSSRTCGNGIVDSDLGEDCEDGNSLNHDGCGACRDEEPHWSVPAVMERRHSHAMAYDEARGEVVLFGGRVFETFDDTWLWNGASWRSVPSPLDLSKVPPSRSHHAMAYDAAQRQVVLFGGSTRPNKREPSQSLGDTWVWDGAGWSEISPTGEKPRPEARRSHAMAYDAARGEVVLFGGRGADNELLGDTWVWDSESGWSKKDLSGQEKPEARNTQVMAYDAVRKQVVLFGGRRDLNNGSQFLGDTWVWDGTGWSERAKEVPAEEKPEAGSHMMAYDAALGQVVLHGQGPGIWVWDGTSWSEVLSDGETPSSFGPSMAYDVVREQMVLFGGSTWLWSGSAWSPAAKEVQALPDRSFPAAAYDSARGEVVLFGGRDADGLLGDTWVWNGAGWREKAKEVPAEDKPPKRSHHAMAYDEARGEVVLFGGHGGSNFLGDTWVWDGTGWSEKVKDVPAEETPSWRYGHAMAYDAARGQVVLFGGQSDEESRPLDDTWGWNGMSWTRLTGSPQRPKWRIGHAMAYDAARSQIVLFGGYDNNIYEAPDFFKDSWVWNGAAWTEEALVSTGQVPSARVDHGMAYDPARGRVVLLGGEGSNTGTWSFDGSSWSLTAIASKARSGHAMVYDAVRRQTLVIGGITDGEVVEAFRYQGNAPDERCLTRQDMDGDGAAGCDDADCWGYCDPTCPPGAASCEPLTSRPHCGDGVCNELLENALMCPSDCE